jgi:DtxR family Mn-dependent transcriptional regulator
MSSDLVDTTEMYLKTVFELHEAGIPPMRARIADRLGHSGPTVSQTVARMERDGLLHLDDERRIMLTDKGQAIATDVMRKHRLAERHLIEQVGLPFELVHEEACRWEHVMSREVETRIAQQITAPFIDPYGNPIPGLGELGIDTSSETGVTPEGQDSASWHGTLDRALGGSGSLELRLRRIGETAQTDVELLRDLAGHGILPGQTFRAERTQSGFRLQGDGAEPIIIDEDTAGQLVVTPATAE